MLDIVQSFPLLSYCIVSPIYISPICNVEIYYSEKIKLGILYFSLFTIMMFEVLVQFCLRLSLNISLPLGMISLMSLDFIS